MTQIFNSFREQAERAQGRKRKTARYKSGFVTVTKFKDGQPVSRQKISKYKKK
mgnify:CR=1 FL=1